MDENRIKSVEMSVFYTLNIWCIRSIFGDVRQMLCSISRTNNNGQEYLLSVLSVISIWYGVTGALVKMVGDLVTKDLTM